MAGLHPRENKYIQKASHQKVSDILNLLASIYPLSQEFRDEIYSTAVAFELQKGDLLLEEGEICSYVYFITKGALMAFSNNNGQNITTYISIENEFVSSISGLHGVRPSIEGIVAVEQTSLIALHTDILQQMFLKYFELNFVFRVFMEEYYRDAQERAHLIRLGNVKDRYLYFIQNKPGYIDRLPLEHIASFLDMKLNTLLKIIKEFKLLNIQLEETELIGEKLEAFMYNEKAYENKMISLGSLSAAIGISSHKLSSLINNHYQLNFVDFVNSYRIKRIKEQMAIPGNMENFTIEALALNAGFASRSSFYNAFKKVTGTSPTIYFYSLNFSDTKSN